MTTTITIGAKVRRSNPRSPFHGREGIVVAGHGPAWLVNFPLVGEHTLDRMLHASELEVVDAGPFPTTPTAGLVGSVGR